MLLKNHLEGLFKAQVELAQAAEAQRPALILHVDRLIRDICEFPIIEMNGMQDWCFYFIYQALNTTQHIELHCDGNYIDEDTFEVAIPHQIEDLVDGFEQAAYKMVRDYIHSIRRDLVTLEGIVADKRITAVLRGLEEED